MHKLRANVICHTIPIPKVCSILPPPKEDLEEVLAFTYIGSTPPTLEDFKHTPFLVCRNKVALALEWLKLNHIDYMDIDISYKNLAQYDKKIPPVYVLYQKSDGDLSEVR